MELKKYLNSLLVVALFFYFFTFTENIVLGQNGSLFSAETPIHLTLKYSLKEVSKDRTTKSNYHKAILKVENDSINAKTYNIQLKTRGIFRLKSTNCYFPPLKLKFKKDEIEGTAFAGYKKLKLVLPCQKKDKFGQYILLEYLAYKIYNLLTEYSFKVRLTKLRLVDIENKKPDYLMYAFLIEPIKSLAQRTKTEELKVKNIHPNFTDRELMNQLAIFQFLIGNTDWSVKALHNIKLLARDSMRKPIAVPYDFDFSGLVNAGYSSPAEHLPINTVRQRHYNGYERTFEEIQQNLDIFKHKKNEIYQLVYSIKAMEKRHIDETIEYFDQFYKMIDNTKIIKHKFIENSRK